MVKNKKTTDYSQSSLTSSCHLPFQDQAPLICKKKKKNNTSPDFHVNSKADICIKLFVCRHKSLLPAGPGSVLTFARVNATGLSHVDYM